MKLAVLLSLLLSSLASAATAKRIVGAWQAAGDRVMSGRFVITRDGNGYSDGARPVRATDVQRLVDAVPEPARPKLDPRSLITQAEVDAFTEPYLRGAAFADAGWLERVRDPRNLASFVRRYFATGLVNAEGRSFLSLDVVLDDERVIHVVSYSEHAFRLPWTRIEGTQRRQTWNPEISRAIAAVWPAFADHVSSERAVADVLHEYSGNRPAFEPFEGVDVDRSVGAYVGPVHSLDTRSEVGWTSYVGSSAWKNVDFEVFLTKTEKGFASIEPFMRDASALASRVRSLRWLPSSELVSIAYHDDRSITATGRETIADDLRIAGAAPLDASALDGALAFTHAVERKTSLWIVLADGTSMRVYGRCTPGPLCPPIGQRVPP